MITPMRFSPDDDGLTPIHSSGYAHVANGQTMGSVSVQSYTERRQLERTRQHVRHYGHSTLGRAYGEVRPMSVPPRTETSRVQQIERPTTGVVTPAPRHTFREPPQRFNPYQ
jgi:hypothetical protein